MIDNEKFGQFYTLDEKSVQLLNDRRTAKNTKQGLFACVLGINSYSSGIHHIRIKIDSGNPYLLIRSRNIPPTPDMDNWGQYIYSPSTYGWGSFGSRLINGSRFSSNGKEVVKDKDAFTITLNCDEHRLSIINENTKEQDEMDIDISCAPFPWCLFIALSRMTAQVSLI